MTYGIDEDLPKPLTEDEIVELLKKYKDEKDQKSREKICLHNLRFVKARAIQFSKLGYDSSELYSIGCYGLLKAIEYFDTARKVKFISFASQIIDNEIKMFIRSEKKRKSDVSLHSIVKDEITLEDCIEDDRINIEDDFIHKEMLKIIREKVKKLPSNRNSDILKMSFGFDTERLTNVKIAEIYGLSQSYINRIRKRSVINIASQLYGSNDVPQNLLNSRKKNQTVLEYLGCNKETFEIIYNQLSDKDKQVLNNCNKNKESDYWNLIARIKTKLKRIRPEVKITLNDSSENISYTRSLLESEDIKIQKVKVPLKSFK